MLPLDIFLYVIHEQKSGQYPQIDIGRAFTYEINV